MCANAFVPICDSCRASWSSSAEFFSVQNLNTTSVVVYDSLTSKVVLKAKEESNKIAQALMAEALSKSIMLWSSICNLNEVILVPIPSTKQAERRRGGAFLHPILNRSVATIQSSGFKGIHWINLLAHKKRVKDQSELAYMERMQNLDGAFTWDRNATPADAFSGKKLLLIDDVVTTGATLSSATKALRERKMTVLGAATVCASSHRLLIR